MSNPPASNPPASNMPASNLPASDQDPLALNPEVGLMFTAADHLIPLFKSRGIDTSLARRMAISAIDAYQPESAADYVNVARTIAFSMAALALLGQATDQDMPMPQKMRTLGRATALNRSADHSERTMMQRRRYQHTNPIAEQHTPAAPTGPQEAEIDETRMHAAIAEAMNEYRATLAPPQPEATAAPSTPRSRPIPVVPKAASQQSAKQPPQPAGRFEPPMSAIHLGRPQPGSRPGGVSHKDQLLHQTAMDQGTTHRGQTGTARNRL